MRVKIIVFDMDGVLVDVSNSWQFVHESFKVDGGDNFRRFLNREISYGEFMEADIGLWGRVRIDFLEGILAEVPLMKGAESTVKQLRNAGYRTAIISAGISILAERVQEELGIDYAFANRLIVDGDEFLTGRGEEVVNPFKKAAVLREVAAREHTAPRCCAVVGDSIFDVPMFREAGFSIAFNANDERVKEAADIVIEEKNLEKVLPYFC